MRILVTGVSGFVGRNVSEALRRLNPDAELTGLRLGAQKVPPGAGDVVRADLSSASDVGKQLKGRSFDVCVHLAGATPPAPAPTLYRANVVGTANLIEALGANRTQGRVVLVSSCAVYGEAGEVEESTPLAPVTAYGESCVAREMIARLLASGQGLQLVIVRLFNLVGPGQPETMMVSAVARQIARIERWLQPGEILVKRLDTRRDYVDIRDAATAIASIALRPGSIPDVVNLGTGTVWSGAEVVDLLLGLSNVRPDVVACQDPPRSSDVMSIRNSSMLARTWLPWRPTHTFQQSVADTLADWRDRVQ